MCGERRGSRDTVVGMGFRDGGYGRITRYFKRHGALLLNRSRMRKARRNQARCCVG